MKKYFNNYASVAIAICTAALSFGACVNRTQGLDMMPQKASSDFVQTKPTPTLLGEQNKLPNFSTLLKNRLATKESKLPIKDSVAILQECIGYGKIPAEAANGKDLVIVVGHTGSGKSTTINYLVGCDIAENENGDVFVKEDSIIPEEGKIGHGYISETFIPNVTGEHDGITYVDCPGFKDNRGAEINIANAVNIRNTVKNAHTLKALFLISYESILSNRAENLKELVGISSDLFNGDDSLVANKDSVLFGITKTNRIIAEANKKCTLKALLSAFSSNGTCEKLVDRVVAFDPLEDPVEGGVHRDTLIAMIKNMKPIKEHEKLFNTILLDADRTKLNDISEEISYKITEALSNDPGALTLKDFKEAREQLGHIMALDIIEHPRVKELLAKNKKDITHKLNLIALEFKTLCSQDRFKEADVLYELLENSIKLFDEDIKGQISLAKLQEHRKEELIKIEARKKEMEEMNEKVGQLSTSVTSLSQTVATFTTQISDLNTKFDDMKRENKKLQDKIDANDKEKKKADSDDKEDKQMTEWNKSVLSVLDEIISRNIYGGLDAAARNARGRVEANKDLIHMYCYMADTSFPDYVLVIRGLCSGSGHNWAKGSGKMEAANKWEIGDSNAYVGTGYHYAAGKGADSVSQKWWHW